MEQEHRHHNRYYQYLVDRPRSQKIAAGGAFFVVIAAVVGVLVWYFFFRCLKDDDELQECNKSRCAFDSNVEKADNLMIKYQETKDNNDYLNACAAYRELVDCMINTCTARSCNKENQDFAKKYQEEMKDMSLEDYCAILLPGFKAGNDTNFLSSSGSSASSVRESVLKQAMGKK